MHFLIDPPNASLIYSQSYNLPWVFVSVLIAILASYAALKVSSRIEHQPDFRTKLLWTLISSITFGVGMWSMHFIGMLALNLPCHMYYDQLITLSSMIPGILAGGVIFSVIWSHRTRNMPPFVGSVFLAACIILMHYTGMAGIQMDGFIGYNPYVFTASIIVAIFLSYFALRVKKDIAPLNLRRDLLVAIVMGGAVSVIHYTAMSATYFVQNTIDSKIFTSDLVTDILILCITFSMVLLAMIALVLAAFSNSNEITKQLRDNEQRLKIAIDSGQVGIWDYNLQTNELIWDDTMFILYRISREDFSGTFDGWSSRLHPDDKAVAETAIKDAISGIREYDLEFRIVGPDGETHYIKGHAHVIKNQAGTPVRVIGTNWDNSAYALTQRQLKFAHSAINNSRSAFFWVNSQGLVIDTNEWTCQSLGYGRNELIGQSIWFFDACISAESWPKQWDIQKKTVTRATESLFKCKDGAVFPVEVTCNYIVVSGEEYCFYFVQDISKRKQDEVEIRKSLSLLSATLESTNDAILVVDLNHKLVLYNQRFVELWQIPDKILATQDDEIVLSFVLDQLEAPEAFLNKVHALYHTLEASSFDTLYFKDGKVVERYSIPQRIDGNVVGRVWSFSDVTKHKIIEESLRTNEEQLRAITDNASTLICLKDLAGKYIHINRQFERVFHVSNATILGKSDYEIFPRSIADMSIKYDEMVLSSGELIEIEEVIPHDDGMHTYISVKFPIRHDSGEIYAVCSMSTDISERKQAEEDLRIAATIFESQEGMLVTDANQVILRVNHAFTCITGYSYEEVIGQTPKILNSGVQGKDFYQQMWDSINSTGAWEGEIRNRRKNGEVYPERLIITAVKNKNGIVTNYVASLIDITLSKIAADEIRNLAFYDPLTALPNRRLLSDRLTQALVASQRSGKHGAILFLDLDHFKTLNDTLGHDIGDLLLKQVAERLTDCVRGCDTVARLSGDEFVVLIENLSQRSLKAVAQANAIGNKILVALNRPYQLKTHQYLCSCSIGATLFIKDENSIDELLKHADIAMYQAKASGRNALCFFDPEMQAAIISRVKIEADLRNALIENQFELYYQPQVHYDNNMISGAEVLIRWLHPEQGFISPADFIPFAEETGLILPIGQWVLKTACAQLKIWEGNAHTRHLQLAVNVSSRQFYQKDFVEQVLLVISQNAIDPNKLKLELTESSVLEDIDGTIIKMNALRKIGVRFSMDDFGTGYSSLSKLKKLPLDQLKIDQSFVRDISTDRDDAIIVDTIIAMANKLNMEVIAEGVETTAQRIFLTQHDCQLFQGYLFSKPVPIEEFELFLKKKLF